MWLAGRFGSLAAVPEWATEPAELIAGLTGRLHVSMPARTYICTYATNTDFACIQQLNAAVLVE